MGGKGKGKQRLSRSLCLSFAFQVRPVSIICIPSTTKNRFLWEHRGTTIPELRKTSIRSGICCVRYSLAGGEPAIPQPPGIRYSKVRCEYIGCLCPARVSLLLPWLSPAPGLQEKPSPSSAMVNIIQQDCGRAGGEVNCDNPAQSPTKTGITCSLWPRR